ncbi:MAG: ATP-binding protein [Patescibacteria group bacterium]|nr:ATP-binding protein [Patescibacteria group bacterium]
MKLPVENRNVTITGEMKQRDFTVKVGAHIMHVLSGLYKNPIDAMVREYLTNMHDAVVALGPEKAKTAKAGELHLPTVLSPELVFKDYGIGMSLDTVWNVYSQYGNSTKNESNNEVGGFGLGSKTAFCYNSGQAWMIESRYNGEIHHFMAFVNESGVPSLTHVSTEKTTEPNGVTIRIPIKRADVMNVYLAAARYVPYFPLPLNVIGDHKIAEIKYSIHAPTWAYRDNVRVDLGSVAAPWATNNTSNGYGRSTMIVVMGNVPYEVDRNIGLANQKGLTSSILTAPLDLFMPIGSVDIVPSRDSLKYTPKTIAAIEAALTNVINELPPYINKFISDCTTEWEAISRVQLLRKQYAIDATKTLTWNGQKLSDCINRQTRDLQKLDSSASVSSYSIENENSSLISNEEVVTDMKISLPKKVDDWGGLLKEPKQTVYVLINDVAKGASVWARSFLHNKFVRKTDSGRSATWGHTISTVYVITTKLSKKELSKFIGGMDEQYILTISDLSQTIAVPTILRSKKDTIYKWAVSAWRARITMPSDNDIHYYLPLDPTGNGKMVYQSHNFNYHRQGHIIECLFDTWTKLGQAKISELYGINSENVASLNTNWVNFETEVANKVIAYINNNKESCVLASYRDSHSTELNFVQNMCSVYGLDTQIPEFKDLNKTAERYLKRDDTLSFILNQTNWATEAQLTAVKKAYNKAVSSHITTIRNLKRELDDLMAKNPILYILADQISSKYNNNPYKTLAKTAVIRYIQSSTTETN